MEELAKTDDDKAATAKYMTLYSLHSEAGTVKVEAGV
jgi:hypothetical protein